MSPNATRRIESREGMTGGTGVGRCCKAFEGRAGGRATRRNPGPPGEPDGCGGRDFMRDLVHLVEVNTTSDGTPNRSR